MLTLYRRGWGWLPTRIFFRPAKSLKSATKWLQLIVGSSFVVILSKKKKKKPNKQKQKQNKTKQKTPYLRWGSLDCKI